MATYHRIGPDGSVVAVADDGYIRISADGSGIVNDAGSGGGTTTESMVSAAFSATGSALSVTSEVPVGAVATMFACDFLTLTAISSPSSADLSSLPASVKASSSANFSSSVVVVAGQGIATARNIAISQCAVSLAGAALVTVGVLSELMVSASLTIMSFPFAAASAAALGAASLRAIGRSIGVDAGSNRFVFCELFKDSFGFLFQGIRG